MPMPTVITAAITSGQSLSAEADLGNGVLVGIAMPAAWDAASLSYQVTTDGTTWLEMQSTSAAISYTAAAGQYIAVDPALWRGVVAVKVRSGTLGAPVNQTANRTISLVTRPLL